MAQSILEAKGLCDNLGYAKAMETCKRLLAYRPDYEDDDARVTEDDWAGMTKELVNLEQDLVDTKSLLQGFYRDITAPTPTLDGLD